MKKILHISKYYSPYSGGIEDACKSLVDGIKEFQQIVLCFNDGAIDADETVDGVRVVRVGIWKEVARQPISFHFVRTMRAVLKDYQPDIVHLHVPNPLVSLYALMLLPKRVKLIVHWHSDIIVHKFIHTLFSPIEKQLLNRADAIIATSPNYIEGSNLLCRHKQKCTVVPNVVSEAKLNQQPASGIAIDDIHRRYGNDIVLFVGRHVGYKGINYLIEAAERLKGNERILIAGKGPDTDALRAQAAGNDNITFLGRIPDDELATYMRAAKVFAFPSITRNEAFGVVLAEAMYCGAVPVTFTIPGSGVNWLCPNNVTGIEVANRDVAAFARAIDSLISDNELRLRLSQTAQVRINSHFVINKIHEALLHLYNSVS